MVFQKCKDGLRLSLEKADQAEAAKRLGVTQPRVSEIVRGKVELLSLDYLAGLCTRAGIPVGVRLAACRRDLGIPANPG